MSARQVLFLLPYLAAALTCLGIAGYVRKWRELGPGRIFSYKVVVDALIVVGFIFETASVTLQEKIIWDDVQYVLDLVLPGVQLLFVLSITRRGLGPRPARFLPLLIPPVFFAALLATDSTHHLIRPVAYLNPRTVFMELLYPITSTQLAFIAYVVLFLFFNTGLLLRFAIRERGLYRTQAIVVAFAGLIPLAGAILTLVGVEVGPYRDMSPVTIALQNIVLLVALAGFGLLEIAPLARDLAVEHMDVAYCAEDTRGRIVDMNAAACRLLGTRYSEAIGRKTADVLIQQRDVVASLEGVDEKVLEVEARLPANAGMSFEVHISTTRDARGRKLGRLMLFQDITAHKELTAELERTRDELAERLHQLEAAQEELVRRERLAVLGKTVATVSHEIRNPLGTVRNALHTLRESLGHGDAERALRAIERAERSVRRCDAIISELLDFSRPRPPVLVETEVDHWLGEVLDDLDLPEGIAVTRSLRSGASVRMDPERVRRAVLNVCENALQALEEKGGPGGRLEVASATSNGWVEIRITDNGLGMDGGTLAHVGEPLFSTKPFGVGLGISVVKSVLQEHKGSVEIASVPGEGTRVVLRMPCLLPGPAGHLR